MDVKVTGDGNMKMSEHQMGSDGGTEMGSDEDMCKR